ncbi:MULTISPECIES: arginine N-succinyltransferase [unclassified Colwellia]|uniref:arginine N-succinyltransferase n=1 Tax=unclassified Colwellia TaxID=196834 RepID=UPI0015F5AEB1|nr:MULTISPECIES: arginine N-succinyltransferase [unclassified Colwellia]MBA6232622.1 arginine N-succinyltransferase [Colwellia sp. MB02u-7]MBA6235237.1 arginine N-succinyltransferase [Colwellia sp. MB02u-11]MBA6257941.1 arginine N-succinyltransferase [Colwellia sp. MB3u-28]MBA6258379.1 arginine N-succinyltransferase [Colwellia sp. MB3u-41]MBA6299287.1 arginine N-succinyltransferase [Colwellia sp. MB3u-22]
MIIIRPIQASDYDSLHRIAIESGHGFTSLPINEGLLKQRIAHSEVSFNKEVSYPSSEGYLFVMEDTDTGQVVGTSGIEAAVGLEDAFYHYHLGKVVHNSRELGIYNTVETLSLCNDYTGASEICTLFLGESHRKNKNGRFLSRCRFLFMAEHQERFAETVIAEMRGISDEEGRSPFWNWLEEHFFSMDFPTADYLTGIGKKVFIAELMPKHPIYVNLLSKDAQKVINEVHPKTLPALRLLEAEGFARRGYVDIFDGGPTVEVQTAKVKTIRNSVKYQVIIGDTDDTVNFIICNTKVAGFRAVQAKVSLRATAEQVVIPGDIAEALQVNEGDFVRLVLN